MATKTVKFEVELYNVDTNISIDNIMENLASELSNYSTAVHVKLVRDGGMNFVTTDGDTQ